MFLVEFYGVRSLIDSHNSKMPIISRRKLTSHEVDSECQELA